MREPQTGGKEINNFDLTQPKALSDAVEALDQGAQALAGGQALIPEMRRLLAAPEALVSLMNIPELAGIYSDDSGRLVIGGTTTHREIADGATAYPELASLASRVGDPAIRNRGTIGGALAHNSPAACYPAAAVASNVIITTNRRDISVEEFFLGRSATALNGGEIITHVTFPVPDKASYQKFSQPAYRYAIVAVFVAAFAKDVRVAVTGASKKGVFRWYEAELALSENFSTEALKDLLLPSDGLIDDIHGSKDYRAHLVKVMTGRAVESC